MMNYKKALLAETISKETIQKIVSAIASAGGKAYIVGGAVRDKHIAGQPASKDVDFLVTGLQREEIVAAVAHLGKAKEVGEAFGVVTARIDGEDFDFALPRTEEKKTGDGHTDFEVEVDPYASPEADLSRRDFTFNAMLEDPLTGEIIDPFGGMEDLAAKVVRTVGDPRSRFREDPLRMLRAIQFATRFGFSIEDNTAAAIRSLATTLKSVSGERVMLELQKAWTKGSTRTSVLVDLLEQLGIGYVFFGSSFDPVAITMTGDKLDVEIGNFVAFFINGGDYTVMKPSNLYVDHLKLVNNAVDNLGKDKWKWSSAKQWIKDDPNRMKRLISLLKALGSATSDSRYSQTAQQLEKDHDLPLTTNELKITGADLMKLGLKGKDLGAALNAAMEGVYSGATINDYHQLLGFLNLAPPPEGVQEHRTWSTGRFLHPHEQPLQPVPMSGQTGQPQVAKWSVANKIMASTMGDEIDAENGFVDDKREDGGINDEPKIADWDVWNTPRFDTERFYQQENLSKKAVKNGHRSDRRPYLEEMAVNEENALRAYVRRLLEVNAISTGGASGVESGNIRGVVTPLGTGPTYPKKSDKKGAKKRTNKRLKIAADSFGGGKISEATNSKVFSYVVKTYDATVKPWKLISTSRKFESRSEADEHCARLAAQPRVYYIGRRFLVAKV